MFSLNPPSSGSGGGGRGWRGQGRDLVRDSGLRETEAVVGYATSVRGPLLPNAPFSFPRST